MTDAPPEVEATAMPRAVGAGRLGEERGSLDQFVEMTDPDDAGLEEGRCVSLIEPASDPVWERAAALPSEAAADFQRDHRLAVGARGVRAALMMRMGSRMPSNRQAIERHVGSGRQNATRSAMSMSQGCQPSAHG